MGRRLSSHYVKTHRQYTYEEAGRAVGRSSQTVSGWRKEGLIVMDSQTPHLIVGANLKAFLDKRNNKAVLTLALDQFRCMRCGEATRAYGGMADYQPYTPERGALTTLCEVCEGACCKFVSKRQLDDLAGILTIALPNASDA
jgi:hypothetical protein